ncbi:MAG: hypothetical protein GY927_22425, partial [bacterium]|nr:hypothetical protein [bacterium]
MEFRSAPFTSGMTLNPNATYFAVFDACRNRLKLSRPGSKALFGAKGFEHQKKLTTGRGDQANSVSSKYAKPPDQPTNPPSSREIAMIDERGIRSPPLGKWLSPRSPG